MLHHAKSEQEKSILREKSTQTDVHILMLLDATKRENRSVTKPTLLRIKPNFYGDQRDAAPDNFNIQRALGSDLTLGHLESKTQGEYFSAGTIAVQFQVEAAKPSSKRSPKALRSCRPYISAPNLESLYTPLRPQDAGAELTTRNCLNTWRLFNPILLVPTSEFMVIPTSNEVK